MGKGKGGQGRVIVKTPKGMPTQAAMEEMKNFDPMKEMMSAMMSDDAPSDYPPQSPANPDMQIRWPERSTKNTDVSMWIKVYPTYLDSSKTRKLGRRIGTDIAIDKPTLQDITEALTTLSIRHVCEPGKKYGRDPESHWFTPGRVLVELFSPHDQEPVHPEAENKLQLIKLIALEIADAPGREIRVGQARMEASKRGEKKAELLEAQEKAIAEAKPKVKDKESGGKKKGKKKK